MIRQLTTPDFVSIWETALSQPRHVRALTILRVALPDETPEQLAALPLGRRNVLLFQTRERVLGTRLDARTHCPSCGESLEFTLTAADFGADELHEWETDYSVAADGLVITYRLPDTRALAVAAGCADPISARELLLQSCIIAVEPLGSDLTDAAVEAMAEAINEKDPFAAIRLNLDCPACHHSWTANFDILGYFWEEIVAQSKSLLVEVAALARGYGWSEQDILSMSAARRKRYLELLGV